MTRWDRVFRLAERCSNKYYKLRSRVLYGWSFGAFGRGSLIRAPILISNPSRIFVGERVFFRDGVRL
jgi:hypothetical protein